MWKSFFGWHKEDVDLYSVNYLHTGAAKIWYCVPPSHSRRFDAMARSLFPHAAAACPAFVRHKDVMISPSVLRKHAVPFVQARQEAGEFVVLNAGAYHAGYNLGFNCAEAVNFALPEWLEVGRDCQACTCEALPEGVTLDMGIFFPELREGSDGEEEEQQPRTKAGGKRRAPRNAAARRQRGDNPAPAAAKRRRAAPPSAAPPRAPRAPDALPSARGAATPRGAVHAEWGHGVAEERPLALVERDPDTRALFFSLAHRLDREATQAGGMWVGVMEAGKDGLYRATGEVREAVMGARHPKVTHVRSEWAPGVGRRKGGWRLVTKEQRILM